MAFTAEGDVEFFFSMRASLAESNAIDLVFVARRNVPPSIAIIKRIDSRWQSVLQIARPTLEIA
jgi:hypothetical protein